MTLRSVGEINDWDGESVFLVLVDELPVSFAGSIGLSIVGDVEGTG